MSLALELRPTEWHEVIGQKAATSVLIKKLKTDTLPNVVMFHGPTGTGKTTMARILAKKLGVEPKEGNPNFVERNCADCRSIDDVRAIDEELGLGTWGKAKGRVYILDEVIQWPDVTQKAALKMLEDTPKHVYFFLCTSDKKKLLDTLAGRCFPVETKAIPPSVMIPWLETVQSGQERQIDVPVKVTKLIAERAEGSARMALQLLESVLTQDTEEAMLEILEQAIEGSMGYQLAQALIFNKGWPAVQRILNDLIQPPETVRHVVLAYAESVLLNKSGKQTQAWIQHRASVAIAHMMFGLSECGRPGLTNSCWRICHAK